MFAIENVTHLDFPHQIHEGQPRAERLPAPSRVRSPAQRRSDTAAAARHDDDLVDRVVLGDIQAAARLRDRYGDALWGAVDAILHDAHEADLVVEAVLEEACRGWPPRRGIVKRWLTRLARRAARARQRALGCDA
jgi:hypothetical protein